MKYGIAVTITETGYIEVESDCEAEAKAIAEEKAVSGDVLFHEIEVVNSEVECCILS